MSDELRLSLTVIVLVIVCVVQYESRGFCLLVPRTVILPGAAVWNGYIWASPTTSSAFNWRHVFRSWPVWYRAYTDPVLVPTLPLRPPEEEARYRAELEAASAYEEEQIKHLTGLASTGLNSQKNTGTATGAGGMDWLDAEAIRIARSLLPDLGPTSSNFHVDVCESGVGFSTVSNSAGGWMTTTNDDSERSSGGGDEQQVIHAVSRYDVLAANNDLFQLKTQFESKCLRLDQSTGSMSQPFADRVRVIPVLSEVDLEVECQMIENERHDIL